MTSIKTRIAKLAAAYAARKDAASGKPRLTGAAPRMYVNDDRTESVEIGSAEWRAWMIAHGEEAPPAA
jgi:hypothetical protein